MILADTSVWIDYLRTGDEELAELLRGERLVCHPLVIGEIACGNLSDRAVTLRRLHGLTPVAVASLEEVRVLTERGLFGRGIGYVDMHLLASARLSPPTRLWTRDRRLRDAAIELDIAYAPAPLH